MIELRNARYSAFFLEVIAGRRDDDRIGVRRGGHRDRRFRDIAAIGDHAHVVVTELQNVGLEDVEGELDAAWRIRRCRCLLPARENMPPV
jgi:hypothetical protein